MKIDRVFLKMLTESNLFKSNYLVMIKSTERLEI